MSTIKKTISSTIVKLLKPLIRILLKNGIPYGTFAELAKWVYTDVALNEFNIPGKKQTVSRASILTGLSRKEVKRVAEIEKPDDLGATERFNRAGRVITGWLKDERFLKENGKPKDLHLEETASGFAELVKDYSGDVPVRALLDEMLSSGVIERIENKIKLINNGYIVKNGNIEKLNMLGMDVGALLSTFNHNLDSLQTDTFMQRKVYYDNLPEEAISEIRAETAKRGADFLEEIDKLISKYDRDINPSVTGKGQSSAGLGIYYFE